MKRIMVLLIVIFITNVLPVSAVTVDPAWYDIDFSQESWLASNTHNLTWGGSNMYVGHVDMGRAKKYDKTASWAAWTDDWHSNVTMVVTSSDAQVRLVNVNDPTKYFLAQLIFPLNSDDAVNHTYTIDSSPYTIQTPFNWYAGGNFNLSILPMTGDPAGYEGTYTTFFRFRVYADYGTTDEILLKEEVMNILVYFISPTAPPPGQTYFTNLLIQRYATADGIDVIAMQQNQTSLTVGAATFSSNDARNNMSYAIRISPAENPLTGVFAFHKTSGTGNAIPYKVHIPARTLPATSAFLIPAPAKGPADYWQDFIEIAISNMNYSNVVFTGGTYQSGLKIELISQ